MTIQRIPIVDRQQWLELRRHDVTASVAGCLLSAHEYITPFELWAAKTGRTKDPEETAAMRRGRLLEPVALALIREQHPEWLVLPPEIYLRDPDARLGATPDLFVEDPEIAGVGVIQVKSVEPNIFRRKWRDEESGEVQPPLWIAVQAIVEAHLAGATWAAVAAMTVGHGLDLELVPVPIHAGVIERVRAAVADFWRMVDAGEQPDADWRRDLQLIETLYEPTGELVDLSDRNDLPVLVDERKRLTDERTAAANRLKEIKAELLTKLDGASLAKIADGRVITVKRVHRKPYQVAETNYLDLRIKQEPAA